MRSKLDVLAAEPAVIGMQFPSRDSNELYVCEIYESKGKLMSYSKPGMQKTATDLVIGCSDPSCGGRFHSRLSYRGQWALTKVVACTCTGPGTVASTTGSTAIPTRALVQLVKPLLAADLAAKSKVIVAAVAPYVYRPLHPSH